jgi:hypothetical protein
MGKTRTVQLNESVAATVEQVAAAEGLAPDAWVNRRLARDLFLEKLDEIQLRNLNPLDDEAADKVVYGH